MHASYKCKYLGRLSVLTETVHEKDTHAVEYNSRRDVLQDMTWEGGHGMDTETDSDLEARAGSGLDYAIPFRSDQLTHAPLRAQKISRPLPEPKVRIEQDHQVWNEQYPSQSRGGSIGVI